MSLSLHLRNVHLPTEYFHLVIDNNNQLNEGKKRNTNIFSDATIFSDIKAGKFICRISLKCPEKVC